MLKTLLLINELTCRIGNAILFMVIFCLSALCARAVPLAVTGCVSALPRARTRACVCACEHSFARCLMVTVKIHTLGINVPVVLSGSLVWWDSP